MRVSILGGGVAGSLLGKLLHDHGHEVVIHDILSKYVKPCGDVVPNVYSPPYPWRIKFWIKNFEFYLDGIKLYDIQYRYPKWIVIDKWEWINSMREKIVHARPELLNPRNFDLVLDSRGPYPMDRRLVYTSRAILKTDEFRDVAVFEFQSKRTGFFWIFPDQEGVLNVGAGFLETKDSREELLRYVRSRFRSYEIVDLRGAPISISPVLDKRKRIGEARGLVFPMSGEGIRPSAISAELAFEAITKGKTFEEHLDRSLKTLERRIDIQGKLLRLYAGLSVTLRREMIKSLVKSDVLIDAYLEDKLDLMGVIESLRTVNGGGIALR